ncbi:DUF1385 domain-containing protein [Caldicellulosiruptor naganoensis]|uniref:DUF1385 domain-containing protein n=1 Tax=Caldicellulosiruptor naganoensis TaxID=29324 RepID=A0ABY7BET2_9FIRM|nr:DUF1385 domain-containing protein [Caldicellulosiruptor naganoensis]WAM30965.1 DUF1385 domain-containing protein [Caldicellulosiruptor naganoensis]
MKKTTIGGMALIEGIMMKGPKKVSIVIRKPNGEIYKEVKDLHIDDTNRLKKIPFIRGIFILFEQMVLGTKALIKSADIAMEDLPQEEKKKQKDFFDRLFEKRFFQKIGISDIAIYFSVALSLILGILLFFYIPTWSVEIFEKFDINNFGKNMIEGIVRVIVFILYLVFASQMKEIKRVFEYHGAEHKTIFAYENGYELNVENIKKFSTRHPRCGTSFLFIVIIISIIIFTLSGWQSIWLRTVLRLLLLPVIVGISYEVIRWVGKSESLLAKIVSYPGLWLQNITTREPDEKQIEVAIEALKEVIPEDKSLDEW